MEPATIQMGKVSIQLGKGPIETGTVAILMGEAPLRMRGTPIPGCAPLSGSQRFPSSSQ